MLHLLLYGVLAIVLAGALFAAAARFLPAGEQIAPPLRDEPPWELPPERAMSPEEVDAIRLPVALRGYRFAETDILLDRLAGELRARDAEIARLRGEEPVAEDAVAEEPVGEEPAAEEPAAEEPVAEEPVAEEPAAEEPAAEEPVGEEPAAEEPAAEAPDESLEEALAVDEALAEVAGPAAETAPSAAPKGRWSAGAPPWAVAPAPWLSDPSAGPPAGRAATDGGPPPADDNADEADEAETAPLRRGRRRRRK